MPRRRSPDPLALAVGRRIRQLREEAGLTIERLAYESELGSKGHLSSIEKGLVRPTVGTLDVLADGLGLDLVDLVTLPERGDRQRLIDLTRRVPPVSVRRLLGQATAYARAASPAPRAAEPAARHHRPASSTGLRSRRRP